MKKLNITPGPWKVSKLHNSIWNGKYIIMEQYDGNNGPIVPREQAYNNAKLMAASPEMFDILKELWSGDLFGIDDDLISKIKHIIEKQEMNQITLTEYYDRLDKHDWFYNFSDDRNVRALGQKNDNEIKKIADTHGDKYLALYVDFKLHYFSGDNFDSPKAPKPERPEEA